uniref:Uncharacterized protein n=1 Tax=Arundo donax TaxID=35708 RepID=A0A0A9CC23_ARUDO
MSLPFHLQLMLFTKSLKSV